MAFLSRGKDQSVHCQGRSKDRVFESTQFSPILLNKSKIIYLFFWLFGSAQ